MTLLNYYTVDRIKLDKKIVNILTTDTKLYLIDVEATLYQFNTSATTFNKRISLSNTPEYLLNTTKALTLSPSCAVTVPVEPHYLKVLSLDKIHKSYKVGEWHTAPINLCSSSSYGTYLIASSEDGRTSLYHNKNGYFIKLFANRPDYVSAVAFDADEQLVAIAYYDKYVLVYDMLLATVTHEIKSSDIVESMSFNHDTTTLMLALRNTSIETFSLDSASLTAYEGLLTNWPTISLRCPKTPYILIGTRSNQLHVFNFNSAEYLFSLVMPLEDITAMHWDDNHLYIGYGDGSIDIIDTDYKSVEMQMAIQTNDWKKLGSLVNENGFLCFKVIFEEAMTRHWNSVKEKITRLATMDKLHEAATMATPFLFNPSRRQEFETIVANHKEIREFIDSIEEHNIKKASALIERHPWLCNLPVYEKLEIFWQKQFAKAKTLLIEDPFYNLGKVRALLFPFSHDKKRKQLVEDLLKHPKVFIESEELVRKKDFKAYYAMVEAHPVLSDTPIYEKLLQLGDSLLKKLDNSVHLGEFDAALDGYQQLLVFSPIAEQVYERIALTEAKQKFTKHLEQEDLIAAFKIAETLKEIQTMPAYIALITDFRDSVKSAYRLCVDAEPLKARELLHPYLQIDSLQTTISEVMKLGYLNEIRKVIARKDAVDWEVTITNYSQVFQSDSSIEHLISNLDNAASLLQIMTHSDSKRRVVAYPDSVIRYVDFFI